MRMKKYVRISNYPRAKDPILVAAWPGMGSVALRASLVLRDQLKAKRFAEIDGSYFFYPTGVLVRERLIEGLRFDHGEFFYSKGTTGRRPDLIIFSAHAQPGLDRACEYADAVLDVAERFGVRRIFTFAAMPAGIDHTQTPQVWGAATHYELLSDLARGGVKGMTEGQISGLNGLLLGLARERGFQGICLLGELPVYLIPFENPRSSLAILTALDRILGLRLNLAKLEAMARSAESEIDQWVEQIRNQEPFRPPFSDDEIEKLKRVLASMTKLSEGARREIERLFSEAQKDVSKASDLKQKLDRWGVYNEYEDRFLDLFRKQGKSDN